MKWFVDLEDVVTDDASEGYSIGNDIRRFSTLNQPTIAPNGLLLLRAFNNAEEYRALIALDPDDGSVVWEVPDIVGSCAQTIDSRGLGRTARAAVEHLAITVDQHDGDTHEEVLLRDPVPQALRDKPRARRTFARSTGGAAPASRPSRCRVRCPAGRALGLRAARRIPSRRSGGRTCGREPDRLR